MNSSANRLTIRRPDDWHVHLRDGAILTGVVAHTARQFARAIVMPNLSAPITSVAAAQAYRQRILAALPEGSQFTPLMTCYLTDHSDPDELQRGLEEGVWLAAKLYPAHATTGSAHGVTDVANIRSVLERMERIGMPLLVHGEVTQADVDVFDREAVFIERHLRPLVESMPDLTVVLEHVTTRQAVAFVEQGPPTLAATITAHHLLLNRGAMFQGGLNPHFYCLPVLKREEHRLALVAAATGGSPKFFLGTDSAPHPRAAKEAACGCAGIFSAPVAIEAYAAVFEQAGALDRLEGFCGRHGPLFYGLPFNRGTLTLERRACSVPSTVPDGAAGDLVPLAAGSSLRWSVVAPPAGLIRGD